MFTVACLFPPIMCIAGVIWKDVLMANILLLVFAKINSGVSKKDSVMIPFLLFVAFCLRSNSLFAIVPLLNLFLHENYQNLRGKRTILTSTIILMLLGNLFITKFIVRAENDRTYNVMLVDDLARYSIEKRLSYIPDVDFSRIQNCSHYLNRTPALIFQCIWNKEYESLNNFEVIASAIPDRNYVSAWLKTFPDSLGTYIIARNTNFVEFLRGFFAAPVLIWQDDIGENGITINKGTNHFNSILKSYVNLFSSLIPFLFMPFFWLSVSTALILSNKFIWKIKLSKVNQAVVHSSTLYILSYYVYEPTQVFRYIYWPVLALTFLNIKSMPVFFYQLNNRLKFISFTFFTVLFFFLGSLISLPLIFSQFS